MRTEYICENCKYRGFPSETLFDKLFMNTDFWANVKHKTCPQCGKRSMVSTYVNTDKPWSTKSRIILTYFCSNFFCYCSNSLCYIWSKVVSCSTSFM